jgi:hypothetical protein
MRIRVIAAAMAAAAVLAACGGGSAPAAAPAAAPTAPAAVPAAAPAGVATTIDRPAALADLASVELREPGVTDAGPAPVFAWDAVDGAATYRLSVLGPDGPRWAWEGDATSIRYGGVEDGQAGPAIVAGSWWSVSAMDPSGELVAASVLRRVSPDTDPGPEPAWAGGPAQAVDAAAGTAAAASEGPSGPVTTETVRPCSLVTTEQVAATLGGEWSAPEESVYPHGKGGSCSWTYPASEFGGGVSISVSRAEAYNPEGWNGETDRLLEGIGEEAYLTRSGMDRKVGFRRGEVSVLLSFDHGVIDFDAYAALARLVDEAIR